MSFVPMTAQMVLWAILRRDRFIGNEASTSNEGKSFATMTGDLCCHGNQGGAFRWSCGGAIPGEGSSPLAEPCYDHAISNNRYFSPFPSFPLPAMIKTRW
jgi:hypothetical protein